MYAEYANASRRDLKKFLSLDWVFPADHKLLKPSFKTLLKALQDQTLSGHNRPSKIVNSVVSDVVSPCISARRSAWVGLGMPRRYPGGIRKTLLGVILGAILAVIVAKFETCGLRQAGVAWARTDFVKLHDFYFDWFSTFL